MKSAPFRSLLVATVLCSALGLPAQPSVAQTEASTPAHGTTAGGERSTPAAARSEQEEDDTILYRHSATVRYLGRKVGLNAEQASVVFQLFNLLVLAGLVGWFLAKVVPKTFRNRSTLIQKQLVDARSATEEASARLTGVEGRLGKLDEQIAAMRAQFDRDAAAEEGRIRAAAEDEKTRILEAAESEIAASTAQAQRQLQLYAAELAIEQAAKKLVVSAETDRLLVQSFAKRLGSKAEEN